MKSIKQIAKEIQKEISMYTNDKNEHIYNVKTDKKEILITTSSTIISDCCLERIFLNLNQYNYGYYVLSENDKPKLTIFAIREKEVQ